MSSTSISKGNMHKKIDRIIALLTLLVEQQSKLIESFKNIEFEDIQYEPTKPRNKGFNNDSKRYS